MKNQINDSVSSTPARGLLVAALAAVMLLASGCSSLPTSMVTQFKDESQLAADPKNENARTYRASRSLADVGAIRVEPVVISATAGKLTGEQRIKLRERLRERLKLATVNHKRASGEDLVITATVVAVGLGNPAANVTSAALLGVGVDLGGVIVELEARGAISGERIAAARYIEKGKPWQLTANFSGIGHALNGVDKAAVRFGQLLAAK